MITIPSLAVALLAGGIAAMAQDLTVFRLPQESPRTQLARYLDRIALRHLNARKLEIAKITTREQADSRKEHVRKMFLDSIGGLPDYRGPLNVRNAGVLDRGDYRIEKIIYESLPRFYVTANIYVPAKGSGPFPAVLMPVGHGDDGKVNLQRQIAIGFARLGFVAMTYDPIGQGERVQYYDPDLRGSKVGGSTDEHSHANGSTVLIGDSVARYRIWDGIRGIDYLVSRKDVDPNRIGCTGCSGGGTLTTYISALDERVKVSAPACYLTSWQELLAGSGPQDGEQSLAGFIQRGLDQADLVELFAPKPLLIVSTIHDFFPLEGARQTWEEAKRFYGLYGAADRIDWFVGPGGHGVREPSRRGIYAWFIKWLNNGRGDPVQPVDKLESPEELMCTPTGQVADSLGGETVFTLNKKRAADLVRPKSPPLDAAAVQKLVREGAGVSVQAGGTPPRLRKHRSELRDGYTLHVVSYESEPGIEIPGVLLVPDKSDRKAAMVVADTRPKAAMTAAGGDLDVLAKAGFVVLAVQPRGTPEASGGGRPSLIGDYGSAFRAYLVGKTLIGMRAGDLIRAVDYLASRPDVDSGRIEAFGQGTLGPAVLYAAVLDSRIARVSLQQSLVSYRMAVDNPVHRDLYEVAIPGVLRQYDLADVLVALGSRTATIINPVDAIGRPVSLSRCREQYSSVFEADKRLGRPDRVRLVFRGPLESLDLFIH